MVSLFAVNHFNCVGCPSFTWCCFSPVMTHNVWHVHLLRTHKSYLSHCLLQINWTLARWFKEKRWPWLVFCSPNLHSFIGFLSSQNRQILKSSQLTIFPDDEVKSSIRGINVEHEKNALMHLWKLGVSTLMTVDTDLAHCDTTWHSGGHCFEARQKHDHLTCCCACFQC